MKILITGGAGYLGKMLVREFSQKKEIERVFALDKKPKSQEFLNPKIFYIQANLAKDSWEKMIPAIPDLAIHSAFDIRSPYGRIKAQEKNNLEGSDRFFRYCLEKEVKKIVYFGSAASYGARAENIGKLLKEENPLTELIYPYGLHKKMVEENLKKLLAEKKERVSQIFVLRLATVNGPEGEKRKKFGLLSMLKNFLPVLPMADEKWARQYIHEKDVIQAVNFLLFSDIKSDFEIFNLAPNDFLEMKDIAKLLGKKVIKIPLWLVKLLFFLAWHLTFGFIPTCPGSERLFIYPTNLDGSKITGLGFQYQYNSRETFLAKE